MTSNKFKTEVERLKNVEWTNFDNLKTFKQIYVDKLNEVIYKGSITKDDANEIYIKLIEEFKKLETVDGLWVEYANGWTPNHSNSSLLFKVGNWSIYCVFPFDSNRNTILIKNHIAADLKYTKEELLNKIEEAENAHTKLISGTGYNGSGEWKVIQAMKEDLKYYL